MTEENPHTVRLWTEFSSGANDRHTLECAAEGCNWKIPTNSELQEGARRAAQEHMDVWTLRQANTGHAALIAKLGEEKAELIVPGAEPLSPTAQALADAGRARDEAAREYREAKTPAQRAAAEQKYEDAEALRQKANEAHRAAREEAGDFGPRAGREAREALKRLDAPKGTHPLAKRLADDHGLKF